MRRRGQRVQIAVLAALVFVPLAGLEGAEAPIVSIPRVPRAPELEDFLEMKPKAELAGKLAKVEGFIQQRPSDGKPSTRHTEVYLGYDDRNLYIVFVCFDPEPEAIRARMSPRENIFSDDIVEVMLDTFHDRRRAYAFITNPFGIQWDALWTEGQGFDSSFDTLWHSRGKLTDQGYVVWMAIPFKSLRFSPDEKQTWGLIFLREMPRLNEETFWPHISSRLEGRLNQAATLTGLENISPGRNVQLIPYGIFRSDRTLDTRDPLRPRVDRDRFEGDGGLDAKIVFKDALVMDLAVNPDFSQVESDEPQVTVNQRFEVFFPEKRPFFLENASYFRTPIDLVFTRRIADPQFGVRGTGKLGKWALGAFVIDDESPGKLVPAKDPLHGKRALFGILRVNRDIGRQSTLGFILTDREFEGVYNRIGGVDGRFKLDEKWTAGFQAVTSWTQCFPVSDFAARTSGRLQIDGCFGRDEGKLAGPAYQAQVTRSGRQLNYRLEYNDFSRGYRTAPGFLIRPDIRRVGQGWGYGFRPEGKFLISWGPFFSTEAVFDHSGTRLDLTQDSSITFEFIGETEVGALFNWDRERLRPVDFPVLVENVDFSRNRKGFFWSTSYFRQVTFRGTYTWGTRINFVPLAGQPPVLADITTSDAELTLRPTTRLRIDNTYIWFRLKDRGTEESVFNNHILRSKWNYQFTRELSLRMILQYDALLANPAHTVLGTSKNFNADFLITYLVHPGTVLFIGYNGNAQNIFLCEGPGVAAAGCPSLPAEQAALLQRRRAFINDAGQFFVKFSYLLRF
ncbi:MAG: DUF5916 domain-containing protein [Candidatus Acidiferrales bacterium]